MITRQPQTSLPERLTRTLRLPLCKKVVSSILLAQFGLWSTQVQGVTGIWTFDNTGNWTGAANWQSGTVPNAIDDIAIFRNDISAGRTVTLNAPITLGGLKSGDLLGGGIFTFGGTSALTMNASVGNAFISKFGSATDVINTSGGLSLASATDFNIFTGAFDVNSAVTGSNNLIKNGAGSLTFRNTSGFAGNFILNYGTLNFSGASGATSAQLGTGTSGISLLGSGRQDLVILGLRSNGPASDGTVVYNGNNNVILSGGAAINVDRNFDAGANDRVNHQLNNLTFNGGLLRVTSGNSHRLTFAGATTLLGQTNVFDPQANGTATLANITLSGAINDGVLSSNLIKEGVGRMAISNTANTYDGVTAVKNGVLQLGAGANVGTGGVIINGGVLSVPDTATLNAVSSTTGGLRLVTQLGTSRYALPVVGYSGSTNIDGSNPLNFNAPIGGAILGIDGVTGTTSINSANIDLSAVGNGSNRVWLSNVLGFDRTYRGTLTNGSSGDLRLLSPSNNLILDTTANLLGGAGATNNLIFGLDHGNAILFTGNNMQNVNAAISAGTFSGGGTVSVQVNNANTLGSVTVNRGVTLNINGAVTTPVGAGVVTGLGGIISTDATSAAQFGNTDFRLYGGSTLLLDNRGVTGNSTNRRLLSSSSVALTSSSLNLASDGAAVGISTQNLSSLSYAGGSIINIGRDGVTVGSRSDLILGGLTRSTTTAARGTLMLRQLDAQAATLGTGSATSRILVTAGAPTPTNGMVGANIALFGGANMQDAALPLFATYDATNGFQAATFTHTAFTGTTTSSIVDLNGAAVVAGTQSVQALRFRSTANTHTLTGGGITLGAAAGAGQGAGLFLVHTSDNEVTHTTPITFSTGQEGLIYTSTTGGSSILRLNGNITGTNGLTTFGDGSLRLGGTNDFGGPLTINAGNVRLANVAAAGPVSGTPTEINLWGGALYLGVANSRYNNNVNVYNDARFSNDNVGNTIFNNLTVQPRSGSTAPVVVWVQATAGSSATTVNGTFNLAGPAQLSAVHPLQINGGLTGSGDLDKFMNDRLIVAGDSSSYTGNITAHAGGLVSYASSSLDRPFGNSNSITINPGSYIVLSSPTNVNSGQVTVNSDLGGISSIGQLYVSNPASTLPTMTINSTAPWKVNFGIGAVGFSQDIDQSSLFGGDSYLGGVIGLSGIYTGNLSPASAGYLLGTSQGTLRIAKPLTGSSNALIGVSMSGTGSRADQVVNNTGGVVQYDTAMSYTGNTILNLGPILRISAKNALNATGDLVLAGGQLRADSVSAQNRMIAPIVLTNNVVMTADSTIQMENSAYDFRIGGNIQLAPGSTGVVRTLNVGSDQPGGAANNAGILYLDGGISDGAGGSGNHFLKNGVGTMFFTGNNTYTGTTTIQQGLIGINADSDWGLTTGVINAPGGGIAVWENSFTTSKNYSAQGGNLHVDVAGGLTLTQDAASVIDGTSSIVKRGLGTLVLNGENAVTGLFAGDGVLQFNNLLSTANSASTGNYSIGGDVTLGGANNGTRYTGGTMRFNFTGTTTRSFVFNNNGNTNFSGGIDVTAGNTLTATGVISQGAEFDFGFKTGPGTLIASGGNTWRSLAMTNGVFQFSSNTPWANSTATNTESTLIEMLGGTIRAVNTGGNIALTNAASTTTYTYGGGMALRMGSGTSFSVLFDADNILRTNQGTLVLETEGATTLGGAAGANSARVLTVNAINASLARGSALNNGIFAPHIIGANASGSAFFLENDATNGFRAYSGATNTNLSGAAPTAIGDISSPQTLTGTNSIYAFRTTADVSGGTLLIPALDNLRTGGVLINGSNTISTNLIFDPTSVSAAGTGNLAEALVYVKSGENATLAGSITSNLFTKFGAGTLTLSGNNTILSDVSVQSGTMRVGGGAAFSRMNSELNINAGATLDLNGNAVMAETIGANNRVVAVTTTTAGTPVGGTITNTSSTAATLGVVAPVNSTFDGVLSGNLKLLKAGTGTLTINGFSASTPDAGVNSHTGGTDIFGYNTTGGINLNNTTTALGGGAGGAPTVNLYSGQLGLFFSNGTTGVNNTQGMQFNNQVVRVGGDAAPATLNVYGPALLNVNQATPTTNTAFGQGNIMTFGSMNLSNATLQISGGNGYRARAEGSIMILGSQAAIQTNSDGPSGAFELTGVISGNGTLNKLGDGTLRGIVISNPGNTYSGGTNVIAGDVQVTATSGTALGSGPVRVFPDGTLRLAGNGSVNANNLTTMSRVNALGAVMLDDNFNPTLLNSTNFSSVYNTSLQLGQPYFTQPLNMAAIGDGKAFLGVGLNGEVNYTAASLGAGIEDGWNPGVGVYRIAPATSSLSLSGVDNVLTGNNYLQVGPQRQNIIGGVTNGGNILVIRNSNDFSGGTQITKTAGIYIETGGRASGETPLGTGAVEIYGELRVRGSQGSLWNASTSSMTNTLNLRPGGTIRFHDAEGTNAFQFIGAGDQGRWGDNVGIDLNGGNLIYNGAPNFQSREVVGAVTARKAGQLQVFRNSAASAATLAVSDISRAERGVLSLQYNSGFLGNNVTTPLSFERITTGTIEGAAISRAGTTTNGAGVINGGMVAPWIIDRTTNSHVGYDPTSTSGTGFQPLLSVAPGAGQLAYSTIQTTNGNNINMTSGLTAGTATVSLNQVGFNGSAGITLQDNPNVYSMRIVQSNGANNNSTFNINGNGSNNTISIASGGLIVGSVNSSGGSTYTVNVNPNLVFGSVGTPVEAMIYVPAGANGSTTVLNGQITAAGLTKFGPGQVNIQGINPSISEAVVIHEGTLYARLPISGTGSPVGQVFNGQDVVLNSGALVLDSFVANSAGTASVLASDVRAQGLFDSDIFVRGDATLGNNGQAQYARISDLTIANSAGSAAMSGNSSITLQLQSGLWVRGTTTLAQEAVINSSFNGFAQSSFEGQVTGQDLVKYGNGTVTLMNGTNNYAGGTIIWGTTNNTAASTVASAFRGVGTPFSTGDIQIQPGGLLRVADNANIASNAVYLRSDALSLGGIGLAHNSVLPAIITSGTPTAGQVKVESTGPYDGVLALDYGYYSRTINPANIGNGNWWIGNSQQNDAYYFNPSIGASANGKYLLGGGGNQGSVQFGSVLVSAGRTSLFENVFTGGTANEVRIEIGAQTADFKWNAPSYVNGNSGYVALTTRNVGLIGDVRVNTNTTLGLGNNFALGSGRLIINGGQIRSDIGNNNFVTTNITINNNTVLQGDFNTSAGTLAILGNVAMSDVATAGATRIWNMAGGDVAVRGVVSGANGSNLIKRGANSLTLTGVNTYEGYTQIDRGTLVISGDVLPGVAGPLGISSSPVILGVESANNSGSLGFGGRSLFARDIMVVAAAGTGVNLVESRTASPVTITGGISVASSTTLSLGSAAADAQSFRGGFLDLQGSVSGAGAVFIGTTSAAPANAGTVRLGGGINGLGGNTYAGGTTLQTARIQLNGSSYFTGPANNPTMLSGPLGIGAITFGNGESNRGMILEAIGGPVTIVNAMNAMNHTANTSVTFGGNQALTFTRNLDLNSDGTVRNRTFAVQNLYEPVTFSGALSASGAGGVSFIKTGPGKLILTGANTFATSSALGVQINQGILQVNGDAALGGAGQVRLNGGFLSVSTGFTSPRQLVLQAASGIDVASGQTLTLSSATTGAFGIRKVGLGTLALNNSANTITTLTLGGAQQLSSSFGYSSHTGGVVSTNATTGTPFAATSITLESGTLALLGGGTAQALTLPTINYGASGVISLAQGTTSSSLTATNLARLGAFNSVNYGTLTLRPSSLANLGATERFLTGTTGLNTTSGGGDILTTPSVFIRSQAPNADANFARYDATTGFREHSVATVSTLATSAPANVADINVANTAAAGLVDIQAIRTSASIAPTDSTTLLRIARGGLIINGDTATTLSVNTLFGTGTVANLTEAIVYVREGQSGASAISGNITARDFTKTGGGILEISGGNNLLNSNATRLPVLSVQEGTFRFASSGSSFLNERRGIAMGDALGHYALNVNESGVFDLNGMSLFNGGLAGNGTVTTLVPGNANLTVRNGFGADTTFSGSISDGSGVVSLTKTQNGILNLNGHSTYSGGTTIQAGRVTNAIGNTAVLGRLEAQTVTALGTGPVTLEGGALRLNALNILGGAQNISEVVGGIDFLRWGGSNGLNVTVSSTAVSNGITLPSNVTSTIIATTQNVGINNLAVNAPLVSFPEGLLLVTGTTSFSEANTVVRTNGGRLFLMGKVDAVGNTITKTGANDLVLMNGASGSGQNSVGGWVISGGLIEARTASGDSNPFGVNPTIEINVGTAADGRGLRLFTDGDGTNNAELVTTYANTNLRFGSMLPVSSNQFVSSGANRAQADRFIANNSFKTVKVNNLEVGGHLGSAQAYFVLGNNDSIFVNGTTNFLRDLTLQVDGGQGLVLNGLISGNGTLNRRSNGGTLYINADNSIEGGYNGGTFFTAAGRNYLGSLIGNQVNLNPTAKLGKGHVWIGPLASFQINGAGNLQENQNFHVSGSLAWTGTLSLASDLSLEQIRLRSNGLGGIQDAATDYFLSARNPSSGVLALGTTYTQPLDMRRMGDGMWYLGSMTNGLGANGAYNAATLMPGLDDTYRLGAGGNTLFFGTNGNANILTDVNAAAPSRLVVGTPMTIQNGGPLAGGSGTVVLMQNQNYTGNTLVNRSSTLDFRGTLTTSGMEVYGTVNAAGEAGTFINPSTGNNIPVTLRPGAVIRFDNTAAGVLPLTAMQGRWQDSVGFNLTDNVIRLQGNSGVEVVETVGAINVITGANRLDVVRGVAGRGTELRTPSITRSGFGTLQLNTNGSQLGSDERVIITGTAPTVTNGMVAPWIINNNDVQFATYNADIGFTIAGFDRVHAGGTSGATLNFNNERVIFSTAGTVIGTGFDINAYALRLDQDVTLQTAAADTATTNRIILGSGGLLSNGTRTIRSGLWAGATGTEELILFNNGTTAIGEFANPTTAGQIRASGITKFGGGTLQFLGNNAGFSGDIRLQQGAVELNYRNTTDISTPIVTTTIGGNGGNIVFEGAGSTLNLRAGQDGTGTNFTGAAVTFNKGIVISDFNPLAVVNVDRSAGTGSGSQSKTIIMGGGIAFGQNNGDIGQLLRLDLRNIFNLAVDGTTTLRGRSSIAVEDNSYGNTGASTVFLRGLINESAAGASLIKGPSDSKTRTLDISHINALNSYTGGTVLQGGILRVMARSTNVVPNTSTNLVGGGLGSGDITLMQGTLDLRLDGAATGAADADIEFVRYTGGSGAGSNLIVKGSSTINADRNNYTGTWSRAGTVVTATLPGGHGFVNGQTVTVSAGLATGNVAITGVSGNTFTYTVADSGATSGLFAVNNNSGSNKMLTFNNMSIGSEILTVSGGNAYGVAIAGTTTLLGNAFFNNGVDFVIGGGAGAAGVSNSVTTDGGLVLINKIGSGSLWVHSTNNDLTGPTYINAGMLDWGNRAVANNTATLGRGNIFVNAGASARTRALTNINSGLGQRIVLTGTAYSPALYRPMHDVTQAQLQSIIATRTTTSNEVTYLAFEGGTLNQNLDQSLLGDGRIYFGGFGDRTLNGAATGSIVPGLANHPNAVVGGESTNRVYRFGNNLGNTLTINLGGTGNLNDVSGPTDVQIGSLASLGLTNFNTGFVRFQDQNTYTGQTVVSRGLTLRFDVGMATGNTAGPLGANADALIDVYGGLRFDSNGSIFQNGSTTSHFYSNIRLRPGSNLTFQDTAATGLNSNRWGDSVPINLDGSAVTIEAANNADNNSETVGAITFDRGSRIYLSQEGTGDAFLTAASVTRAAASTGAGTGRGTLVFTTTASTTFGALASVGAAQTQFRSTAAITPSATSAVTGMLPGYYVESQGARFVKNGANGITPVVDLDMVAMPTGAGLGNEVVNVTGDVTMGSFETSIFALRSTGFSLNSPTGANNNATITFTGSGSDVGGVVSSAAFVINPNLKFGASGTNEAIFYTGGNITVNGNITAGGVTKFGIGGSLIIANDQSDAARGAGNGYSSGWVVNEGAIQFSQFGSAGNADPNNTIVLNGAQAASAQLNLRAQAADTLLNYTYTSGRIIAVDNATIDWDPNADDRVHTIADLEIQQSGGIGNATANGTVDAQLRIVNNRNRSILAAGTFYVTNNAILNVDTTAAGSPFAAYTGNGAYLTNGLSSGFSVASLVGTSRLTKWGDGTLYVRGDSSATFSGNVIIDQGAVHVTNNGSLGSGALIVNRYGVLDIGVANFSPTNSSLTYNEGSIERWSVNNARSGAVNLGKGTLQIAANQPTTNASVTLDGGGIEAFLRNDDNNAAQGGGGVMRILNPNVTFTLNSNSFIGTQYYLGANGLDNGKQAMDNMALTEYTASGAVLEVQGVIGGVGGLTKVGYDTVILSGNNTYQGETRVQGGRMLLGKDNALPTTTSISTTANGVLDLNGQNQTVGSLTNPVSVNTVNSTSGFITNAATSVNTLTVGNGVSTNFSYSGVIQHNVALTKIGTATLTLRNANSYVGATTISAGTVALAANGSINDSAWLNIGSGAKFDVTAKSGYTFDGRVSGGGMVNAGVTYATALEAARIEGALTIGHNVGAVSQIGSLAPGGNSGSTIQTAGNQIGHIFTSSSLTLLGPVAATPTTRLSLQVGGATASLFSLGYSGGEFSTFIDDLPTSSADTLNGITGTLSNHDYLNVGGAFTITTGGRIEVSYTNGYAPAGGDLFNLMDWGSLVNIGSFTAGPRLRTGGEVGFDLVLPSLAPGQFWDTSLFLNYGTLVVVPEPGRVLLMMLGLMALFLRRRRQR